MSSQLPMSSIRVFQCLTEVEQQLKAHEMYFGHGTDNAWDEACWLVETILRRAGVSDYGEETIIGQDQHLVIMDILARRISEKLPLAYLLGEAWFADLIFNVDARVLVPRSPIAELILNEFEPLINRPPLRILDLCTGSGCIGIASALVFPQARVDLADVSLEALSVAQSNIEKYKLNHRVRIIPSDVFETITGSYDLIISNPPYISKDEYKTLPNEYYQEPELGLVSELDGMAIPAQIINEAAGYLNSDGVLILEVGHSWPMLAKLFPKLSMLWLDFEFGGEGVCMLSLEQLSKV